MRSKSSQSSSGGGGREPEDRRETLLQRRERVLGPSSLRYVDNAQKAPTTSGSGNKRRGQILQAQRIHRQRTIDYITELEAEIFRLRESEATLMDKVKDKDGHLKQPFHAGTRLESREKINIHVLLQCLNGQIGPGLLMKSEILSLVGKRAPHSNWLEPNLAEKYMMSNSFSPRLSGKWNQQPLYPSLESHDSLTRMLFLNFSENIAPTLVAFDGLSNGYRTLLLPLAWDDELVRWSLMASSANHLRFARPCLTNLALNLQAAAIDKLTLLSKSANCVSARPTTLAAIILLLINGMMNGSSEFQIILNMAKSWIEAMSDSGTLRKAPRSTLDEFLLDQVNMMQLYAQPLLNEQAVILSQYDCYSPDFSAGNFSFNSKMHRIFALLESAIRQACSIYSYHILNDGPPHGVEDLLETLKNTVAEIPNYTPGENALAWVYFIAAAESSNAAKRSFFAKRLMGVYERGTFPDVTTAFTVLHQVWGCQIAGKSWKKVLMQMPLAII